MNQQRTPAHHSRRRHQRGQVLVLFALFAVVLLAAMAIATDLSVSTHFRRSVQTVTDAAALAGAKELPAAPTAADTSIAAKRAVQLVHNTYGWNGPGGANWLNHLIQNVAGCGAVLQCSLTVCATQGTSMPTTGTTCTETDTPSSSGQPFILTVNAPPKTAAVASYNGNAQMVEVRMKQQTTGFFNVFVGQSDGDASQSVAYHFAAGQPFPFALFSRTIVQSGNQGETIAGNIYAARYIYPQSNGHAGVCAAPDPNGNPGYIYLGYPQQDDGTAYTNYVSSGGTAGQASSRGDPILDGQTCPSAGGTVAMSATPLSTGCSAGLPGGVGASNVYYDTPDGACEANPPIQPPTVAGLPNLPVYTAGQQYGCGGGVSGGVYQPGEYSCAGGNSINASGSFAKGIYEIDHAAGASCDVTLNDGSDLTAGVTFYLKGGAILCVNPSSGVTVSQTPYNAGTGDPGDGKYSVISDNVGNPSITMNGHGGGSTAGVYSVSGTIWLPTGTVSASNKNAIEDTGQVIVNAWLVQSGNHLNPGVTYNGQNAPPQNEILRLVE